MLVDEAEGRINYHLVEIESEYSNIVLVEFLLKLTSNNGFQLLLDALLNLTPEKN